MTATHYIVTGGVCVLFALGFALVGAIPLSLLLGLPGSFLMLIGLTKQLL
jgi:hypothetical protein